MQLKVMTTDLWKLLSLFEKLSSYIESGRHANFSGGKVSLSFFLLTEFEVRVDLVFVPSMYGPSAMRADHK